MMQTPPTWHKPRPHGANPRSHGAGHRVGCSESSGSLFRPAGRRRFLGNNADVRGAAAASVLPGPRGLFARPGAHGVPVLLRVEDFCEEVGGADHSNVPLLSPRPGPQTLH